MVLKLVPSHANTAIIEHKSSTDRPTCSTRADAADIRSTAILSSVLMLAMFLDLLSCPMGGKVLEGQQSASAGRTFSFGQGLQVLQPAPVCHPFRTITRATFDPPTHPPCWLPVPAAPAPPS